MGQPRMLVVMNNVAAKSRTARPAIERALKENGIAFDRHVTQAAGDATAATRQALRAGYETIAVVGGDGTLSEAAEGFFALDEAAGHSVLPQPIAREAVLAILPAGTGDDFARGLCGRREPLNEWISRLAAYCRDPNVSRTRIVDVILGIAKATTEASPPNLFICLNVSTIGFGAEVAGRVAAQGSLMQRLPGEARFVGAAVSALAAWRERALRITIDETNVSECRTNLIAVANGVYAGGGMKFAPAASVDDGQLDVLTACGITRRTILRELPRIRRGTHLSNPGVRVVKARSVAIEAVEDALPVEADGNVRGTTPAEFRIMPAALRMIS